MKLVRTGITRDVLLIGRWAIKFPNTRYSWRHFTEGLLANMTEASTWHGYSGSIDPEARAESQKLCPVLWSSWGGWIVVMPRVLPMVGTLSTFHVPWFVTDVKEDNFGILDGRVVCVDYA